MPMTVYDYIKLFFFPPCMLSSLYISLNLLWEQEPHWRGFFALYFVGLSVYAADRIGDEGFNKTLVRSFVGLAALGFLFVADKMIYYIAAMVFWFALLVYPLIKQVPYLKSIWVPYAFVQAACSATGNHNILQRNMLAFSIYGFSYGTASGMACDIKDIKEDRGRGRRTLATKLGPQLTTYMAALLGVISTMAMAYGIWVEGTPLNAALVVSLAYPTMYSIGLLVGECPNSLDGVTFLVVVTYAVSYIF